MNKMFLRVFLGVAGAVSALGAVTPVAHYGAGLKDRTGKSPELVRQGEPTISTNAPIEGGASSRFDATNQCLSVARNVAHADNFVVEVWAAAANASDAGVHAALANGNGARGFILGQQNDRWVLLVGGAGVTPLGKVRPNTWTHLAVAKSGGWVCAFLDGVQVGFALPDISDTSVANFSLGATAPGKEPFNGWVAEAHVATFTPGAFDPASDLLLTPAMREEAKRDAASRPVPYPTLNPPWGITPAQTRWPYSGSFGPKMNVPARSAEEQRQFEARLDWFHKAKYGIFFHFLSSWNDWDSETWNKWVDAVDVEKVAEQAKEIGAGYVIITLGQNHKFACAPNPVMDELWGLQPGQFNSRRDLPMDLYRALAKRGIPMMLYIAADNQHRLPMPASFKGGDRFENWLKVAQWWSDHYGAKCKGWWVDGLNADWVKDYRVRWVATLKHGNPDAIVACGQYEISDFLHGHCSPDFAPHQRMTKPFFGRWDPDYKNQWHAFQYIGPYWGAPGCNKSTADIVRYASDIVKGGGVITFDLGVHKMVDGKDTGPFLEIQPDQFEQLKGIRDALKDIPASDGSGRPRETK